MDALRISPDVLEWAAREAGETVDTLAATLVRRPRDRQRVTSGELTFTQLQKLAKLIHIPVGLLFLESPPERERPKIPDLRQLEDNEPLSVDFYDVLADTLSKQQWYREHLRRLEHSDNPWVGRFPIAKNPSPEAVAEDMRAGLKLTDADRARSTTSSAWFSLIASRAEDLGILVMKSGIVGPYTRRPLAVREFRGFALADREAPLVFVNGRDADAAWCFTLAHELAHIWTGETGVSDTGRSSTLETLCNKVAGILLAPRDIVSGQWNRTLSIDLTARYLKISRVATARRLLDFGLITQDQYQEVARLPAAEKPAVESEGGNPWATIPSRNSKRFTRAVVAEALAGRTLLRDAGRLLNIRPDTVMSLSREL